MLQSHRHTQKKQWVCPSVAQLLPCVAVRLSNSPCTLCFLPLSCHSVRCRLWWCRCYCLRILWWRWRQCNLRPPTRTVTHECIACPVSRWLQLHLGGLNVPYLSAGVFRSRKTDSPADCLPHTPRWRIRPGMEGASTADLAATLADCVTVGRNRLSCS